MSFPRIFTESDQEQGDEKEDKKVKKDDFSWGLTPLLIMVAKETSTPIKDLYDWAITEFLYYATYLLEENDRQIRELRKHTNK